MMGVRGIEVVCDLRSGSEWREHCLRRRSDVYRSVQRLRDVDRQQTLWRDGHVRESERVAAGWQEWATSGRQEGRRDGRRGPTARRDGVKYREIWEEWVRPVLRDAKASQGRAREIQELSEAPVMLQCYDDRRTFPRRSLDGM